VFTKGFRTGREEEEEEEEKSYFERETSLAQVV
jgi:hypothetical protein